MRSWINMRGYKKTYDQINGIIKPDQEFKGELLKFESAPTGQELYDQATRITTISSLTGYMKIMINSDSFFVPALSEAIKRYGIVLIF